MISKTFKITTLILLLLFLATLPGVFADTQVNVYDQDKQLTKSVVFKLGVSEYFVDNEVPGVKTDVAPFIENDRTYVPIRYLSNALGVTSESIAWESPTVTLTEPGFPVVELAVGSKTIKSDGKTRQMDVSPIIRDSRTFLPARFVAEALGYQVDWDAKNQIVTCWPAGAEKPDIQTVVDYLDNQLAEPIVEPKPEPKPEPTGKPINLQGRGEPVTNYGFGKYMKPTSKINWLTYDEFQNNVYEVNGVQTYGLRVTKDQVYLTQYGGVVRLYLYEGGDILRGRSTSCLSETRYTKHEYPYTVVLPSTDDCFGEAKAYCDITKVSHILIDGNSGMFLGIENPLYKGGK